MWRGEKREKAETESMKFYFSSKQSYAREEGRHVCDLSTLTAITREMKGFLQYPATMETGEGMAQRQQDLSVERAQEEWGHKRSSSPRHCGGGAHPVGPPATKVGVG